MYNKAVRTLRLVQSPEQTHRMKFRDVNDQSEHARKKDLSICVLVNSYFRKFTTNYQENMRDAFSVSVFQQLYWKGFSVFPLISPKYQNTFFIRTPMTSCFCATIPGLFHGYVENILKNPAKISC